jgi:hypothetical protein
VAPEAEIAGLSHADYFGVVIGGSSVAHTDGEAVAWDEPVWISVTEGLGLEKHSARVRICDSLTGRSD